MAPSATAYYSAYPESNSPFDFKPDYAPTAYLVRDGTDPRHAHHAMATLPSQYLDDYSRQPYGKSLAAGDAYSRTSHSSHHRRSRVPSMSSVTSSSLSASSYMSAPEAAAKPAYVPTPPSQGMQIAMDYNAGTSVLVDTRIPTYRGASFDGMPYNAPADMYDDTYTNCKCGVSKCSLRGTLHRPVASYAHPRRSSRRTHQSYHSSSPAWMFWKHLGGHSSSRHNGGGWFSRRS